MLQRTGAWAVAGAVVFAGVLLSCTPAPRTLTWTTAEGPAGLFSTPVAASWRPLEEQGATRKLAFATEAAVGAQAKPTLLRQRAMKGASGLMVTFERISDDAISIKAWVGYVGQRAEAEVLTHNQLTDRTIVEHIRDGRHVRLVVQHQSFGGRGFYEVVRMEERQGILLTARLFVPERDYHQHAADLQQRLAELEWAESVANEMLPPLDLQPRVILPSI